MTNKELCEYMAQLVLSTTGPLEKNLLDALGDCDDSVKQRAMILYSYYKANIMDMIIGEITHNDGDVNDEEVLSRLSLLYNDLIRLSNERINEEGMRKYRFNFGLISFREKMYVNKCASYILCELGPSFSRATIINIKFTYNMCKTYDFLKSNVINKLNGGYIPTKASSGIGCLLPFVMALFIFCILSYL